MQFTSLTLTMALATAILAVPVPSPQANKIGAGVYNLGTGVDDSTGYDVQNVGGDAENILEDSTALTAIGGPNSNPGNHNANNNGKKTKRQANKIGAGVYNLGTGVDDSTGYDVQNVGGDAENILEDSTALTAIGGPNSNPGNHNANNNGKVRRQANKIGAGVYNLGTGVDDSTGYDVQNVGGDAENILEDSTALTAIGGPNSNPGNHNANNNNKKRSPQLGNDAAGAEAILDGVDSGFGQGIQNGEGKAGTLINNEGFAAGQLIPDKKKRSPQLGNDAAGAEAILDGVDSGFGQGIQNGEGKAGTLINNEGFAAGQLVPDKKAKRAPQLGNDAAGAEAILDGADSGFGQGIENGEIRAGHLIEKEGFAIGNLVPDKM